MAAKDIKLLGARTSLFVNRVQFALNIKSIEYEFLPEYIPFNKSEILSEDIPYNKSELLLKSNPVHKKVPVLIHGDKPICESLLIVEYIDEAWCDGPSILPSDPYERANARFWAAYIDDKWILPFKDIRAAKDEESKAAIAEKLLEGASLLEDAFLKCSKGKGFFGGETIGYLDIVLGCYLQGVKAVEIMAHKKILDEAKTPALVGWAERFLSHKDIKGVMYEPEELIEILKTIQAKMAAATAASQ